MSYNTLKQVLLFERIKELARPSPNDPPPFTLIVGSGFSFPLIPTTSEIVREDLPWWCWCRRNAPGGPTREFYINDTERKKKGFEASALTEALDFWQHALADQAAFDPGVVKNPFKLGADGLPTRETVAHAYTFALSHHCTRGLNNSTYVRRYFGDIIQRVSNRLNPAHLFLGAIVAEFPRLFGTTFTTNFDPLLQRALQLFNAPYFVSDRPDTLEDPDDDNVTSALHLVHAHGSIFRYILASSPAQIEEFANKNHDSLQRYFRKHSIILVGFSGWDDAITRALMDLNPYHHNLYWCDRGATPDTSGLSDDAKKILSKPNSFYVPIESADALMAQMHQSLVGFTLPKLLREPIAAAREQLDVCSLKGVLLPLSPSAARPVASAITAAASPGTTSSPGQLDLGDTIVAIRAQLVHAEALVNGEPNALRAAFTMSVRRRLDLSSDPYFGPDPVKALDDLEFVVENLNLLEPAERALALFRRGVVYGDRNLVGDLERAIADYTAVIDMPDAPEERRARALVNRGFSYGQRGQAEDVEREIADYTAVIDMPDVPADQRAMALVNRGFSYGQRGQAEDVEREIADYTAVIDMPDAPADQRAKALVNRGITYGQRGQAEDVERVIADYTAVIDMPDAPADQRAKALVNRGFSYGQRGQAEDVERAIADYTAVIDMPDAPADQRAMALVNRGITYGQRGQAEDVEREIADYTAVIDMPDAPAGQRAMALVNRGITYGQRGQAEDVERVIADYTAVIDMPDAPADQRAKALVNRGFSYGQRGQAEDVERAIADYTAVIDMPDAPADQRAKALVNRGFSYGQRGQAEDVEREIADYTAVIDMPDAPAGQRAMALVNRGITYGQRGQAEDVERVIADYTAVIDMPDAPEERRARALVNRGFSYGQRGQAEDVEREIADYTAVIDMPDVPADQRAKALVNRGFSYGQRGQAEDVERAIADYTAVIDMPDAPADQRAKTKTILDRFLTIGKQVGTEK